MRSLARRLGEERGQALIEGLLALGLVLLVVAFAAEAIAYAHARSVAQAAAQDGARIAAAAGPQAGVARADAVRAAVEAPTAIGAQQAADDAIARAEMQSGVPLQLRLEGTFARGAALHAETSAQIDLASVPFIGQHGSVLITGLLLTLALLMVLGAAVDIGHAFIVRRDLSSLADNAALAGAQQLDQQAVHQGQLVLDPQQAQAAALSAVSGEPGIQVQADATSADVHVLV